MTEATGPALGFIAECPELATLEQAPLAPRISRHIEVCESCQLVLELLAAADVDECVRFEPLLAARADGANGRAAANLLTRHLASCDDCRAVADTMSPTADAQGDHDALPRVAPESYEIGLEIGKGGMGRVFAARDLRIGRPVAVKELLGRSQQLAARFEREARITARLQHPGIVPIYEIGRWPDGTPFYSMRIIEGDTLRKSIAAAATLAERLVLLPAVITATEAVAFAHAQRIIHRDLTPSNVLVGAYGETVVIDWGLAKDVSDGRSDEPYAGPYRGEGGGELTGAGAVVGTAAYMPPEQANAESVDERADVYALGAILYHLLAGKAPYTAHERPSNVLDAVKAGPPTPIDEVAPAAPRDLLSIVAKAMARDPDARYPSARELAEELKRFQTGRMVEAHEYTTLERMRRFVVRNRGAMVVTGIALLVLLALGFVAVRRVLRESDEREHNVLVLFEEEGRTELLDGNPQRALAYFDAAYAGRTTSRALRFMRAAAIRDITTVVGDLECGSDVRDLWFDRDRTLLVASCHDVAKAWRIADRTLVATYRKPGVTDGFDHLEYTHDGKRLVTYGGDGVARMWDAASGTLLREFKHKRDDSLAGTTITFATFTPDDRHLATTGYDGWWRYWDVATGEVVVERFGAESKLFSHLYGVLDATGTRLLTFTITGHGVGWDVATGKQLASVEHGSIAGGGSLSPDGTRAATCGMNRLVKLWSTDAPGAAAQLAGATDTVFACKFSDDGTRVIGTSQDGHAYVWNVSDGAMVANANHGSPVWTGHFSADGRRFVSVGFDGSVKVWDTETGGLLGTHDTSGGHEARFSPDGTYLIAARGDGRIRIWRDPGVMLASYRSSDVEAVSTDGSRVVVQGGSFADLVVRDAITHASIPTPSLAQPISTAESCIAATNNDHVIVIATRDGARIADLAVGGRPTSLALSRDGKRIAVMFSHQPPEVWDVSGSRRARLDGASFAKLDASGSRAVAWSDVGGPRVWDLATGTIGPELAPPAGDRWTKKRVARADIPVGFAGDTIVLFDEGDEIVTLWDGHAKRDTIAVSRAPAIDPRGRYLTTILADHSVKTWDLASHVDVAFVGERLKSAQPDPSGELVAGIDRLGTSVLVLGARDGRVLAQWAIEHESLPVAQDGLEPPFATAEWSSDGKTIISRSTRQVALWNADTDVYDERGQPRSDRDLSNLVRAKVPWRVSGANLVRSLTSLHATIRNGREPLANRRLTLVFRKPADLSGGSTTWDSAAFTNTPFVIATDASGHAKRDGLQPGTYKIIFGEHAYVLDIDIDDGNRTIDLDALATVTN